MSEPSSSPGPPAKKLRLEDGAPATVEAQSTTRKGLVAEQDVGIELYLTEAEPFRAILKHRYSDFIVHEIDPSGHEVRLTDLEFKVAGVEPESENGAREQVVSTEEKDPFAVLAEVQLPETVDAVRALAANRDAAPLLLPPDADKARRTHLHQTIKSHFRHLMSDVAKDEAGTNCIRVFHRKNKPADHREDNRKRKSALPGDYCEFYLYKTQRDTNAAVSVLAKLLRMSNKSFSFAGTKDKRAITCQRIRCYRARAEDIHKINKQLMGMRCGHYSYANEPLRLGELKGNKFTIVLRNIEGATDAELDTRLQHIRDVGFLNYFGMQRFGTSSIPTHEVGRAVLKGDFKKAVELILAPRVGETPDVESARKYFAEHPEDYDGALKRFPKWCQPEISVLHGLKRDSNDYLGAFQKIARGVRTMYVHAYQSYVWNRAVSERVRQLGLSPVAGDLVAEGDPDVGTEEAQEEESAPMDNKPQVRVLTEEDIASGRYDITDVVLPLPGNSVLYPAHAIGQFYKEFIKDDIGLDAATMRHNVKEYSLRGAYRKILLRPRDLEWNPVRYDDEDQQITYPDLDKAEGKPAPELNPEGRFRGLVMSFSLPAAAYATMLFRELTHGETHSQFHANMTGELRHKAPTAADAEAAS